MHRVTAITSVLALGACTPLAAPILGVDAMVPAEHHAELFQEALDAILLDVRDRLGIEPSRAAVPSHTPPCLPQDVTPVDAVVQGMEAPTRCPLGRSPQSPLQSSDFVLALTRGGLVGTDRVGHALALTCLVDVATAGALPSRRVVRHGVRGPGSRRIPQYYCPLGLPLRRLRFRRCLIRWPVPRRRRRRRVSRVPFPTLHTCCAPYPAVAVRAHLRTERGPCCLRREMSGSANGLFLCRGCRLHFMLRPACLLPAARLSPSDGLLTPRSAGPVSR